MRSLKLTNRQAMLFVILLSVSFAAVMVARLSQRNYDQIQIGMSHSDVARILGGPSGQYTDKDVTPQRIAENKIARQMAELRLFEQLQRLPDCSVWLFEDESILVFFDAQGTVIHKTCVSHSSSVFQIIWARLTRT